MKFRRGPRFPHVAQVSAIAVLLAASSAAQDAKPAAAPNAGNLNASMNELQSEVHDLKDLVQQLAQETRASRAEITRLRQELESERAAQSTANAEFSPQVDERIGHLEEEQQLLTGKVDEQYQTKLESASKYRIRFSGIALFNLFSNQGTVDNIDVPTLAYKQSYGSSSGSFGGTLRQSIFGFEVFGPELMGAKTSGSVNFDAGGGFPDISNGVNSPLVRLRTATLRLDWKDTDVVAGQDRPALSSSPTRRLHSPPSSCLRCRMPAICGPGLRNFTSIIASP